MKLYRWLRFRARWWWWLLDGPARVNFGFGPESSRNWQIAMDRWERREPKLLTGENKMTFLTAILPPTTERVCGLSHEFLKERGTPEQEHELREFIALCLEMGAMGFFVEEVESRELLQNCIVERVVRDAPVLSAIRQN